MLADLPQPALKRSSIPGRLGVKHPYSLPQCLDAPDLDFGGLLVFELLVQSVARGAPALSGIEVGDDRFNKWVRRPAHLDLHEFTSSSEALFERSPQSARLCCRDSDARHHHALQEELPFVRRETRFVCHGRASNACVLRVALWLALSPSVSVPASQGTCPGQADRTVSFAFKASMAGFKTSATPG